MGVNYDTNNRIDFQNFHQNKKKPLGCAFLAFVHTSHYDITPRILHVL